VKFCLECNRVGAGVTRCPPADYARCRIVERGFRAPPEGSADNLDAAVPDDYLTPVPPPQEGQDTIGDAAPMFLPDPYCAACGNPDTGHGPFANCPRGNHLSVCTTLHSARKEQIEKIITSSSSEETPTPMLNLKPNVVTSPDGNPKTAVGITKPALHAIPPVSLLYLGQAMADGNRKYGLVNWRHDPITVSTYYNALLRHALAWWDGQETDPVTGIDHLAYIMANCAILLDAREQGTLTDDRPTLHGKTAEVISRMTRRPE
jgi:hypothetical protein